MRWAIYILFALIAVSLDASVGGILRIADGQPRFLPCVVVFALLSAPRQYAVRIAMVAGLLADLLSPAVRADGSQLVVIGPWVLGFSLGALAVVPLRTLLYHRNPIANGFATMVFGALAGVVFVAVWTLRGTLLANDDPAWWPGSGAGEVWRQLQGAFASGLIAIPTIWLLNRTRPLWGFSTAKRVIPGVSREAV
jgi:cell shape-determining protein MreD